MDKEIDYDKISLKGEQKGKKPSTRQDMNPNALAHETWMLHHCAKFCSINSLRVIKDSFCAYVNLFRYKSKLMNLNDATGHGSNVL